MNTRTLLVVSASVAAMIAGCESIDKSALAGAGLAVVESVVGGKPDNRPIEFEYRKEGGK